MRAAQKRHARQCQMNGVFKISRPLELSWVTHSFQEPRWTKRCWDEGAHPTPSGIQEIPPKRPEQLETVDFDTFSAFRALAPGPAVIPRQRKLIYRSCNDSLLPPLINKASLTEANRLGDALWTRFVEVLKALIRGTEGRRRTGKQ